jgi:hypothetical protein
LGLSAQLEQEQYSGVDLPIKLRHCTKKARHKIAKGHFKIEKAAK